MELKALPLNVLHGVGFAGIRIPLLKLLGQWISKDRQPATTLPEQLEAVAQEVTGLGNIRQLRTDRAGIGATSAWQNIRDPRGVQRLFALDTWEPYDGT